MNANSNLATKTPTDDQLTLVSRLYYVDGLGQAEVARIANVSQAKISRMLAQAKERGIVRISVAEYDPRNRQLESSLRKSLGLTNAIVIKCGEGVDPAALRQTVGYFGGPLVRELLKSKDTVAIAGGRTICETMRHLPLADLSLRVVQAMGHVDAGIDDFDAEEVGRVLVQRLGGSFLSLNTPAFIPEKTTRNAIFKLEQVRLVRQSLREARVALVGIGTLNNSVFAERGTLTQAMIDELRSTKAVGEICGRFFDAQGKECATRWRDQVVSITFEELRNIPNVLAIASGDDRAAAIAAAARGGLIKGLMIDEAGAKAVLQFLSGSATPGTALPKRKAVAAKRGEVAR